MTELCNIWLEDAEKTHFAGKSLASSLYTNPVTILLTGELGAGKTTFLNGFSEGLGIHDWLPSPTFALENSYETTNCGEFRHIDLYRLTEDQAREFMLSVPEEGVTCIEWAERIGNTAPGPFIHVHLADGKTDGRELAVAFQDQSIPSREQILAWRAEVGLTEIICKHCDAVADLAVSFAEGLQAQGHIVRVEALRAAAELHDLLRFVDFTPGGEHEALNLSSDTLAIWDAYKQRYKDLRHEAACAKFLRENGYSTIGDMVEFHGLMLPSPERTRLEQKLLYYADKRVMMDQVVTLEERFADFEKRYGHTDEIKTGHIWLDECKRIEQELFG